MEPATTQTPTHRLIDVRLGDAGPLEHFVRSRRAEGRSWRLIAQDLYEATHHEFSLTYSTLRTWFPDADQAEATS